jgi:hypothetical protein
MEKWVQWVTQKLSVVRRQLSVAMDDGRLTSDADCHALRTLASAIPSS